MTEIAKTRVVNIELEKFESLVYARKTDEAGAELMANINLLRMGAEFVGHSFDNPEDKVRMYTRFSVAIAHLFCDPQFVLSESVFERLGVQHSSFSSIFDNSVFETSDFMAPGLIDNPTERDPKKFIVEDMMHLATFLLVYCFNSSIELNFNELCKKAPKTAMPLYLGMLSNSILLSARAHERHETLLEHASLFSEIEITDAMLPAAADAYMYSSYGTTPLKHDIKRTLSASLRRDLLKRGVPELSAEDARKMRQEKNEKPLIVVPLDWMNTHHAMYRCFAPSIIQLGKKFRVIGIIKRSSLDENAHKLFDGVEYLPEDSVSLSSVAKKILEMRPDIVWYPSVGMSPWWVALSNLRLAPIQCMSFGHPASSFSPMMDYVMAEPGQAPDKNRISEIIATIPEGAVQFIERDDYDKTVPEFDFVEGPIKIIRVAIPAMIAKINYPFLLALKKISEICRADHEVTVEYHFFPNGLGAAHWQARKNLKAIFKNCVVHPRGDYSKYMETLKACHLHFGAFPFGGTNSNVDSFLLGIPVLAKHGPEPHEAYDRIMLNRVGLAENLSVETEERYIEVAVRLATDTDFRFKMSNKLRSMDIREEFFGELKNDKKNAVVESFYSLYLHHENFNNFGIEPNFTTFSSPSQ